ncbi:hypothetical protein FRB99_007491 [Tulasnella sp. 403]|nr:hypothetical protein FRB99_007491 [Tulasnella sp. 403]
MSGLAFTARVLQEQQAEACAVEYLCPPGAICPTSYTSLPFNFPQSTLCRSDYAKWATSSPTLHPVIQTGNKAPVVTVKPPFGKKQKIRIDSNQPVKASGSSSDLFRGHSSTSGIVALKRIRITVQSTTLEDKRSMEKEVLTWKELHHPNVLEFLGKGEDQNGFVYLVSPWMNHGSLWDHIQKHPHEPRVHFLRQTAEALAYLHRKGVVHGDIKAENVLLSDQKSAKLCDFKMARTATDVTVAGFKGNSSLQFQAPELWMGVPRSPESDVYAFGMLIYQVLTGKHPFEHLTTHASILNTVMNQKGRPKTDLSRTPAGEDCAPLWRIAEKCWNSDPKARPTMEQVTELLRTR